MTDRIPPEVRELLSTLQRHDVRYILVGSVAVQAWGVDVGMPGDLDIVPDMSRENLVRLTAALRDIEAVSWPITGRWTVQDDEFRWESFHEDHPLYGKRITDPDPSDSTTFDSLFATRHGELDIVPLIAGSYDDLAPRASRLTVHGVPDVLVSSVADLLARLTVPRREKDAGRVRSLRAIQRKSGRSA